MKNKQKNQLKGSLSERKKVLIRGVRWARTKAGLLPEPEVGLYRNIMLNLTVLDLAARSRISCRQCEDGGSICQLNEPNALICKICVEQLLPCTLKPTDVEDVEKRIRVGLGSSGNNNVRAPLATTGPPNRHLRDHHRDRSPPYAPEVEQSGISSSGEDEAHMYK